jgi:hypothetical protein
VKQRWRRKANLLSAFEVVVVGSSGVREMRYEMIMLGGLGIHWGWIELISFKK